MIFEMRACKVYTRGQQDILMFKVYLCVRFCSCSF
jgi:hypothetical protein